jgi:hypothetical protein
VTPFVVNFISWRPAECSGGLIHVTGNPTVHVYLQCVWFAIWLRQRGCLIAVKMYSDYGIYWEVYTLYVSETMQ